MENRKLKKKEKNGKKNNGWTKGDSNITEKRK